MSDAYIFFVGVLCFTLLLAGTLLTRIEFKKISAAKVQLVSPKLAMRSGGANFIASGDVR